MIAHEQGAWISPPFVASDYFGGASMTWTVTAGQVTTAMYRLSGRTLFWALDVRNTTLGGTPTVNIIRKHFGGFTLSSAIMWATCGFGGANTGIGIGTGAGLGTAFYRDGTFALNFTLGSQNVLGTGFYEIS